MLPSLDQDANSINSLSGSSPPKKQKSAGVQTQTKNGKKNGTAKDGGGGVLAAVTKNNAAKMNTKSTAIPSRLPDAKPAAPATTNNPVTSPLLDALSSAALTQNTNEWAKNVPAYSSSPSNLINLGESPPTVPSSYEDRLASLGWNTKEQRGMPSGHPPSISPPANNRRRPLSYHLEGNHAQSPDDHHTQASSYAARRSSMYSQYSNARYGAHHSQPPLPHLSQAHFYGAPDTNLLLSPQQRGLIPGEYGYYCGFDSLPPLQDASNNVENVVLTGYEGGIDVHTVSKRGLSRVATIEGLRGGVYNAKILPCDVHGTSRNQPLIALVVHGPVWQSSDSPANGSSEDTSNGNSAARTGSIRSSPRIAGQSVLGNDGSNFDYYQTTVEVYSLHTKQHVATLLSVPRIHIAIPMSSPLLRAPAPVGALTIRADSGNIVIASGTSGEIWIYRSGGSPSSSRFKCIGKVWGSVQHGLTVDPTGLNGLADGDWQTGEAASAHQQYTASILSLNGRWLAYCPSSPSSQVSLRASVPPASPTARTPGLTSQAPPQLPTINCLIETPGEESALRHMAQVATQEVIKNATYLGNKGYQVVSNYFSGKNTSNQPVSGGNFLQNHNTVAHQFPPTHSLQSPVSAATKDPGLISILDLETLAYHGSTTGTSLHPLATFKSPQGCSFLSFAPNGLALFAASSKGDVQFVWDLMRIQFAKPSFLKTVSQGSEVQGPHIRQIAQFSRMTIARIVDVVWTSPHGERAVMVTEPGTIHVLDLPASAFTWPPPRRKPPITSTEAESGASAFSAASTMTSNAFTSVWAAAKPLVRPRRSSASVPTAPAASMVVHVGQGTQALAAGFSRSMGAATGKMKEMHKSSGKRLHLPRSAVIPSRSCIRLLTGKRNDSITVVGGGIIGIFTVKSRRADLPADRQKAAKGAKYIEFRLPSLPDLKVAPEPDSGGDFDLTEKDTEDLHWSAKHSRTRILSPRGTDSSIPQAEIETNAPYQPFHTDRRVALHCYTYGKSSQPSPSVSALLSPLHLQDSVMSDQRPVSKKAWAFGGPIATEKLNVGPPQDPEDSYYSLSDYRALPSSAIERVIRFPENVEGEDHIVSTTRVRKGARSASESADADEDGFFEDDAMFLDFASQRV